ncbi:hypothetical protein [Flavobacterium microcysteis]|uniref:Uncharacterized protein n=1 Tax=Flavobacterium microcysteis TaxID=2596891 RepID=A0A501QFG5_9FLAO|nr:hypothetical protein [Flavobacterium microcysteis]TPD71124.1 hypothetical protein FJA49_04285 [Flavobacterium microcysteis]
MPREKLTEEDLLKAGIGYSLIADTKYFSVKEIKNVFPNMKFNIDNIRDHPEIGRCVRVVDIEPMTDFDISIRKFNRKK